MKKLVYIVLVIATQQLNAQILSPPLKGPLTLSGNFGELRPSHFHMGLDFKTDNKENQEVYAVADGYVSRILISSNGYGKALYITHPTLGLTSVYAHLNQFSPQIQQFTNALQQQIQANTLDTIISPNQILVKTNQFIALSGNTGGSEGPHLHFELRSSITEKTINPMPYFKDIKDNVRPVIDRMLIYNTDNIEPKIIHKENYPSKEKPSIISPIQSIGLGISVTDFMSNTDNKFGIYLIKLYVNDTLHYSIRMDSLDFSQQGYTNWVGDLSQRPNNVFRLFHTKCSQSIFGNLNLGIIKLSATNVTRIHVVALDRHYNTCDIHANIFFENHNDKSMAYTNSTCDQEYRCKKEPISIILPPYSTAYPVSDSILTTYHCEKKQLAHFAIGKYTYPVFNSYKIIFNTSNSLPKDKLYLKSFHPNAHKTWVGSSYFNFVEFKNIKLFGEFAIELDTEAPTIALMPSSKNQKIFKFIIKDDHSGINKYDLYIDQQWQKLYYDQKNNLLIFEPKISANKQKHNALIIVGDKVNNISKKNYELFY